MNKPVDLIPTPVPLLPAHRQNFMYALMNAVGKDQDSMSQMQIVDSKTTMLSVTIENALYQYWNNVLEQDDAKIQAVDPKSDNAGQIIQQLQEQYNVDSAKGQSNESQQDGMVQAGQGQTSTDASNLQMKAQMIQAVNGIQSALTNMLGVIVS